MPPASKTRQVPIELLHVDDAYQRIVRSGHVDKIAAAYDPHLFGFLTVNDRSGALYVIDGQHRLEVAKTIGLKTVPCQVFTGLSGQEEAGLFYALNLTRLRVNSFERFNALRYHGDEDALRIDALVRSHGWKVGPSYAPGVINALSAVEGIYNRDGAEGLDETFTFIKETWNGSDRATEGQMIRGVSYFIRAAGDDLDLDEVSRKIALVAPAHILNEAFYQNKQRGGGVPKNVARTILAEFNKARRTKVRVPAL